MTDQENEIIKCPFCFTESERGIEVCRGCHATVKYGESLLPYFIISLIIGVIGGYFILRFLGEYIFTFIQNLSGSAGFTLFGIIAFILFVLSMYILLVYVRSPDARKKVMFYRKMPK
ncbi:hypothetical protein ACLSZC_05555 [Avibacterium avium]|uniref:hypothetical protein n=1 Tax=Avibacterium avium TaxID=751 RepID=UPI003BF82CB8